MYNHHQQSSFSTAGGGGGGRGAGASSSAPRGAWSSPSPSSSASSYMRSSSANSGAPGSMSRRSSANVAASTAANGLAALADWAARGLEYDDRGTSTVAMLVDRCTNPANSQPNLALNLELADHIKQKKANTPREAAVEVVRRVNSRHPHVSMLALHLLDHLVKNCGYPFHLQIATKEFLNELVKRFPERPPLFATPVQSKILELVHEWKNTICVTSKHREDLVHIRDMHRLLGYKGYRFPNFDARAASVMNPENTLQTPEELEEEDRDAQGAKLQELIRRGTPRDLQQAQELMKIMSGAEPEKKPDYRSQTAKELDKVQSRAMLLNDMLDNATEGERFVKGDAYEQIASHLRSVQPRLQRWISEAQESDGGAEEEDEGEEDADGADDAHDGPQGRGSRTTTTTQKKRPAAVELLERLLLINDLINQVVERYRSFQKGDFSAKVRIDPSIDPQKGGADAVPTAKITDLISFDDEGAVTATSAANPTTAAVGGASLMDEFASLRFDAPSSTTTTTTTTTAAAAGGMPKGLDLSKLSRPPMQAAQAGQAPPQPPPPPQQQQQQQQWGAVQLPMGGGGGGAPSTTTATGTTGGTGTAGTAQKKDPFADLDGLF